MLSLLRLERKQKKFFKTIWNSHISLSCLLTCNRNDKYVRIHTHRSSLENHYPIPDQNEQSVCPFSDQNNARTLPVRAAHIYMAYIREYPPREKFLNPLNEMQIYSVKWTCKRFLRSYGSYDSTTITRGLLPTRQARKFLSPVNEMSKSTRQLALSPRIMSTVLNFSQHQSL